MHFKQGQAQVRAGQFSGVGFRVLGLVRFLSSRAVPGYSYRESPHAIVDASKGFVYHRSR